MVVGSERRVCSAQTRLAATVEGRLDGDGGVTRTVEAQRLSVARLSRVTGDDPGQVVCYTKRHWLGRNARGNIKMRLRDNPPIAHMKFSLVGMRN